MRAVRNRRDVRQVEGFGQTVAALLLATGLVLVLGVVGMSGLVGSESHDGVRASAATVFVGVVSARASGRRRSPGRMVVRHLGRLVERSAPGRSTPCTGHDCLRRGPPLAPAHL